MDHRQPRSAAPAPLLRNILLFGRLLRAAGITVSSASLIELVQSLAFVDIGSRQDFRNAARCILVNSHTDLERFDQVFEFFWRRWMQAAAEGEGTGDGADDGSGEAGEQRQQIEIMRGDESGDEAEGEISLAVYSAGEVLRGKDFSQLSPEELTEARELLRRMHWAVARRRARRRRPAARGRALDVRRSIRRSLRHGGEILHRVYRAPSTKRRRLVVLCDISGSMDRYTRLLLHFLHSVEASMQRTEVFVFGTRLSRITPALRHRDPDQALAAVADQVQDWSGGTRIGEALHDFNRHWARRVLGQGAIVLVISDGWDRGDPDLLAAEMERLQRSSYRLLWLNPLLGVPGYEPLTLGMQAALPYVDDFLPIHNLASLQDLAGVLNAVQEGRPPRQQRPRFAAERGT